MITVETTDDGTLRVAGEATVFHAEALHAGLCAAAQARRDWTVDLGGLTELDTTGAQLFVAFRKALDGAKVHSCPPRLREFVDQLGLAREIL